MTSIGAEMAAAPQIRGLAAARIYAAFFRDPLACFRDVDQRHGPLCLVQNPLGDGRRRFVLALGPRYNAAVLSDVDLFRTSGQGLSGPRGSAIRRVRNGLTRTRGEKHRRMRALFMPSLQKRATARAEPRIQALTSEALAGWHAGQTRDLTAEMRALSLRISSEVLFAIQDPTRAATFGRMLAAFLERSFSLPVLATRKLPLPGTPYRALHRHAERFERQVARLVEDRRNQGLGEDPISAMLRALDEGAPWIEEEDLVGQITLLFGASYETTAQALTWTLFLLAQHPEVARELLAEVEAVASGSEIPTGALDDLPLLANVVKESLRLFPPIPYTMRICTRDCEIDALSLRRGDRVLCSHFFTHRVPETFARPLRFEPDRWQEIAPGPYEYLPFSVAPRMCIGAGFAETIVRRVVAEVLRRFRFRVVPGARIDLLSRISLAPRGPLPIALAAADGEFRASPLRGTICDALRWDQ